MKHFFETYQLPLICGALGLLLAILLITIGFFKTILLVFFTCLGIALGLYLQSIGYFDRFSSHDR